MPSCEWTLESLYTHLSALIAASNRENALRADALESTTTAQARAAKEAVEKAHTSMERRFENTNEWRSTLSDVMGKMMMRTDFDAAHSTLTAKTESMVEFVRERQNSMISRLQLIEGKASGIGATLTVIMSIFATVTALAVGLFQIVHLATH
jgi:hypothetical protein